MTPIKDKIEKLIENSANLSQKEYEERLERALKGAVKLVEAFDKVITISDRKHNAWDEAKLALKEFEEGLENG